MILPALAFVLIAAAVGAGAALIPREARPRPARNRRARCGAGHSSAGAVPALADDHVHDYQSAADHTERHPQQDRQGSPLNRINEVSYERSLMDRILGCGSLNVQTAAEDGMVVLRDVPNVEHVSREITQLLFGPQGTANPPASRS